jgi:GT2 family glycosyltransferase
MSVETHTLSIVSHNQNGLVELVLDDLEKLKLKNFAVIITYNLGNEMIDTTRYSYRIKSVNNEIVKGFGSNHNQAFTYCKTDFFYVVNPDIRFPDNFSFDDLSDTLDNNVGACSPLVIGEDGDWEDHARKYPSIFRLFLRHFLNQRKPDYVKPTDKTIAVDWCAGMFIGFHKDVFSSLHGFDEKYFMYCEDIDICRRLNNIRLSILVQPSQYVTHCAQRKSRGNLLHLYYHISSLLIFWKKYYFQSP